MHLNSAWAYLENPPGFLAGCTSYNLGEDIALPPCKRFTPWKLHEAAVGVRGALSAVPPSLNRPLDLVDEVRAPER
jgi:hypothetical protein